MKSSSILLFPYWLLHNNQATAWNAPSNQKECLEVKSKSLGFLQTARLTEIVDDDNVSIPRNPLSEAYHGTSNCRRAQITRSNVG